MGQSRLSAYSCPSTVISGSLYIKGPLWTEARRPCLGRVNEVNLRPLSASQLFEGLRLRRRL